MSGELQLDVNDKEMKGSTYHMSQGSDSFGEGRVGEGIRVQRVWSNQQSLIASLSFPVPVVYFIIRCVFWFLVFFKRREKPC